MCMRFVILLGLLLAGAAPLAAQPDSTFIELFQNRARVNTGLKVRQRIATFSTAAGEEFELRNENLAFRIGGRYKWASYTFSIPLSDLRTADDQEQSSGFGLGVTLFMRQQLVSARFRSTIGFTSTTPDGVSVFRSDVSLFSANVFGFYVLNNKRYSLRASFKQRDRQLQRQGSFLIGGLIDRVRLKTDEGIFIPLREDSGIITRFAQTKFGFGLGYAHTFMLGRNVFFTPFAIIGPEFRFITHDEPNEVGGTERVRDRLTVSPRLRALAAFGWNGRRTAVALTGRYVPTVDRNQNISSRIYENDLELRITRRFLYGKGRRASRP